MRIFSACARGAGESGRGTCCALLLTIAGCVAPDPPPPAAPGAPPQQPAAGLDLSKGATYAAARGYYGIPILSRSFFWDGNGEVDEYGGGLLVYHFISDHVAVGGGYNAMVWMNPGHDAFAGEAQGALRIYPRKDLRAFLDLTSGYVHSSESIPPHGTVWNFSFGFGGGIDVPVAQGQSLLFGVNYHHISNALGRESKHNPSQNEAQLWIGYGWSF